MASAWLKWIVLYNVFSHPGGGILCTRGCRVRPPTSPPFYCKFHLKYESSFVCSCILDADSMSMRLSWEKNFLMLMMSLALKLSCQTYFQNLHCGPGQGWSFNNTYLLLQDAAQLEKKQNESEIRKCMGSVIQYGHIIQVSWWIFSNNVYCFGSTNWMSFIIGH